MTRGEKLSSRKLDVGRLAGFSLLLGLLVSLAIATGASGAPGDVTASKVKDIAAVDGSSPDWLTAVSTTLFFSADDGTNGVELWKSDGTPGGTTMVVTGGGIGPAGAGSNPNELFNFNGTLFFSADDGTNGFELWKSDGTSGGTTIVTPGGGINANPGPSASSSPHEFTNVNGTLLFAAFTGNSGNELWKTDGSPTGTEPVMDINPGNTDNPPFEDSSNPGELTSIGNTVYFAAYDGGINGAELWKSVPPYTAATMVKDINTNNAGADSSNPMQLTNVGGTLYFNADDGTNGQELWKSDGTPGGTTMVPAGGIYPGATGSSPDSLTDVNGVLFFAADDGTNGTELWRSDGTASGTTLVEDAIPGGGINPGSAGADGSFPDDLANVNGTVFFAADDGTNGTEPWKSDGTPSGTKMVKDGIPGANGSSPQFFANVNGTAFFQAVDDTNGIELWKSDGTASGTAVVEDAVPGGGINPGIADSSPDSLTNVAGTLFFSAQDAPNNTELWKATIEGPPQPPPTTTPNTPAPVAAPAPASAAKKKCKKKRAKKGASAAKKKCKKKKKRK
jgi:ELWxxDGT repeat protein